MGEFLIVVSLVVFLWAVVGIIRPAWARLPGRLAAVGVWILSVVLFATGGALLPDQPGRRTTGTSSTATTADSQSAAEPRAENAPQRSASTFGNGTHLVGTDIQPGTYRAEASRFGGCYWSRLSGLGGDLDDIIANEIVQEGSAIVTIEATDRAFESTGCGRWQRVSSTGRSASTFGNGTHLVGADIQPGTYRAQATGSGCYWSRLSGLGGDLDDIIANEIVQEGSAIVTIEATDRAFNSNGCGQWQRVE